MFVRSIRFNNVLSVLFVLSVGACGGFGSCGACGASQPLPAGGLPANQTIEGGAQIRITPSGFTKLTSILPGVINSGLGGGFCVPSGSVGSFGTFGTGARWCDTNNGGCNPGCKATTSLNPGGLTLAVTNAQTLNVGLSLSISATVHVDGQLVGVGLGSCNLGLSSNDLGGNLDIAFGIKPSNGELDIHLANINAFQLNVTFSGCGILSDIGNLASSIIDAFASTPLINFLTPLIDNLIQGFLPNPLGIEGMLDVANLVGGFSPGTQGEMEERLVPGGYVSLAGNGMSLGMITGINSDLDPTSRTGTRPDGVPFASEPALCVPPLPIPLFGQAPYSLPLTSRNTFGMIPANAFAGLPDPAADLAMGISQTTLDQLGHHLVTSGAMCLGVGTAFIRQLNVGTIGLLVPSLADLQSDRGNDPLLLVTRPQREVTFKIGDNTTASPAITIGLSHLEVDFYAFLYERYVRAFTLDLTANIGINLAFEQMAGMPAMITPTLVGLSADQVTIKVLNSDFVKETPAHLEMVLPSVFNLLTGMLAIPPIQVPTFAGFSLSNLSIQKVSTTQDAFLALYASLGAGFAARQLALHEPFAAQAVANLDAALPPPQPHSTGSARLTSVRTPAIETVRGALLGAKGGKLPTITFDVDRTDALGRPLEWAWNIGGGIWHEYSSASPLVISDPLLAWEGKYTIGLKSRVQGDYTTVSSVIQTPVVIDSVGPKIFTDKATWDGDEYQLPVFDIVSGKDVQVAFGRPGEALPTTAWTNGDATMTRTQLEQLAVNGEVAVYAKDELGNQTVALIAPFHGSAGAAGCACNTSGGPGSGTLALFGIVGFAIARRRRTPMLAKRRRALAARVRRALHGRAARFVVTFATWLGISAFVSMAPGCSCHSNAGKSCETVKDCDPSACPSGQIPFCIDNTCVCSDDIPPGRIGPYSDVATAPDGSIWVSAYAQSHGDLVVAQAMGGRIPDDAWEWVDGVPDGPVVVPGSKIRGGIADDGEDVGMYTSIAVGPDGTVSVSYFDRGAMGMAAANLKFAQRINGVWQTHIVDQGTGSIAAPGGSLVGMYTSLTLRSDDGRPGIAYLAHVSDATGEHAEVRYVAAQTATPTSSADWQMWKVDTAPVPAPPAGGDVYPLPGGLGLFIDSARNPTTQAPHVVYYDRSNGELKLSKLDPNSGQFTPPVVLDGSSVNVDAGWSPSIQVDTSGVSHVAYVNATTDDLVYVTDATGAKPEIVDDGYRVVGTTVDGLPKPEFHFVGDDAGIVLPPGGQPMVVYQDSTTQELLLAQRQMNGMWTHTSVAGATMPWPGAYGFFASAALNPGAVVLSTWVIDQPADDNWVEVFSKPTGVQ